MTIKQVSYVVITYIYLFGCFMCYFYASTHQIDGAGGIMFSGGCPFVCMGMLG